MASAATMKGEPSDWRATRIRGWVSYRANRVVQLTPPEPRARESYDRSCSLTMTCSPSAARPSMIASPNSLSDEYGDQVGAYSTVGVLGSSDSERTIALRFKEPSTRQSSFGYPINGAENRSSTANPASM